MIDKTQRTRAEMPETRQGGSERNLRGTCLGAVEKITVRRANPESKEEGLMEQVVERGNMSAALKRVESNGGASGVGEMPIHKLLACLKAEWPRIKEELLKANQSKSAVDRDERRKFLGCSMTFDKNPQLKVAEETVKRLKAKLRECFR